MVRRLHVLSLWRWVALCIGLLCAIALAHPMAAHAARTARVHTATTAGATPDEIAVTGVNGALWAEGSHGWFSLGGVLLGAPAVASIPNPDGISYGLPVFVGTGSDHRLYVRDLSHPWRVLVNAYCLNNPAAVVTSAHAAGSYVLTVACEGRNQGLYYAQEQVASGVLPATLPGAMQPLGGVLVNGPAVAAVNPLGAGSVAAEMTFFVLGQDQHIWTRTLAAGWQRMPWQCIGHPAASTSLSSVGYPFPPQITMFACHGLDGRLWISKNTGSGWSTFQGVLGGALVDGPGVAVEPQWTNYYVEGTNAAVWDTSTSNGNNALGWSSIGGLTHTGAAAAALLKIGDNP